MAITSAFQADDRGSIPLTCSILLRLGALEGLQLRRISPLRYSISLSYFVYILRSIPKPHKTYIGFTSDLEQRLFQHNEGESRYTNMHKPWKIETFIAFSSKSQAEDFEKYLKTGSGGAFMKRHLLKK
jgi:putative endonuclease